MAKKEYLAEVKKRPTIDITRKSVSTKEEVYAQVTNGVHKNCSKRVFFIAGYAGCRI
jgi:hypothetical protein